MTRLSRLAIYTTTWALVALGSGCGGDAQEAGDGVKRIELWQGFTAEESEVFKEIMADFEKDYESRTGDQIELDIQFVSFNDMFTKLRTAAMARITPDIAFVDAIKVTDLAFGKALIPVHELDGFKERYGTMDLAREEFVPASFDSAVVNRAGEVGLYGLPVQTTTVALFWNKAIFRQKADELRAAGLDPNRPPRDWQELVDYGKVLTDPAKGLYAYGHYSSLWFNFPIFNMYNVGMTKYDEKGNPVDDLNNKYGVAALRRIQEIVNSGVEGGAWKRSALGPDAGFLNNRYAMCLTGPWNVESFTNAGLDFDIALIPSPTAEEIVELDLKPAYEPAPGQTSGAPWSSSNVGGQTGVIMQTCEDPELALEVLEYFTSEEVQRRWASGLGQIPVRKTAWEDLDMSKYPYMTKFMEQLALSKRIPQIPLFGVLENDIFNPQMDLLLQNKQTAEQMVEKMDREATARIYSNVTDAIEGLEN